MRVTVKHDWSRNDLEQLAERGIGREEAERQLALFAEPTRPFRLLRPCTAGDGVERLSAERRDELAARWRDAAAGVESVKFVPASGAATRMFGALHAALAGPARTVDELKESAEGGDPAAADARRFLAELDRFPFRDRLAAAVESRGADLSGLLAAGRFRPVLAALLEPSGLGYGEVPKALVDFHLHRGEPRTAFEEQLVEGVGYLAPAGGRAAYHFTVAPKHRHRFERAVDASGAAAGGDAELAVDFSEQSPATDTLAVDADGRPVRAEEGELLLRPGGHGALLGNVDRLAAAVAFVKNIDNVLPPQGQPPVVRWKTVLAGRLLELQERLFPLLDRLAEGGDESALGDADALAAELGLDRPAAGADPDERRRALLATLDRPVRVCGMVENEGEPGGGPFWVEDREGGTSRQIVEPGEVDHDDPEQEEAWRASTHFNPVDLVCGLRDHRGRPHPLDRFADPSAVVISPKRHRGRPIRVLERPGLWNGAMARWITLFVEVPSATFAPVKSVLDLLRPEHRAG